ncbi:MAG TPA: hypothetical protein VEK08_13500 [Planctomycetota bacterium]|nr:hypothetical protein [Planctomycetota bacterium]
MARARKCILVAVLVCATCQGAAFQNVLTREDIDTAQCASFLNGKPAAPPANLILSLTGAVPGKAGESWRAGHVGHKGTETPGKPDHFAYRIAFTRPVKIATLFASGDFQKVWALKSDAAYPGDITQESQWQPLDILPRQSGARTITPAQPIETRALLFLDVRTWGESRLRGVRVFSDRFHNMTPWSLAYADREYYKPPAPFTHDFLFAAGLVSSGQGAWFSSGKDKEGRIPRPPINDVTPSWFMLTWPEKQTISGLWIDGNLVQFEIDQYVGPETMHPRAGIEDEWKRLREVKVSENFGQWIHFTPVTTRALRIRIHKTQDPQIATIAGLHAFTALENRAAPTGGYPVLADEEPPVRIPYQLDDDLMVTMVINAADGSRVRNLFARREKKKGENVAGWDLRDEYGKSVPAGTYTWSAISYPRLQMKYEMTPYPNVAMTTPDNSPWLNGHSGPGGWMADHTPPACVTVAGERVYLGSVVAESGISLIECDLSGKKLWGHHSFAAWTGARFLAATKDTVFAACNIIGTTTDGVWAIDQKTKEVRDFLKVAPSSTRKRGMRGIAAFGERLYISINAQESALNVNAATPDEVDYANCTPVYPKKRQQKVSGEIVPDPHGDFAKLFRMVEPVAGGSSSALTFLEAQKSASRRQHIVLALNKPVAIGSLAFPVPQMKGVQFRLSFMKLNAPYPPEPENEAHWINIPIVSKNPWQVIALPDGVNTRALRMSFIKSGANLDDPLASLIDTVEDLDASKKSTDTEALKSASGTEKKERDEWFGQLEGMKLLRERFAALQEGLTVRTSSGKINDQGEWDAERTDTLTETNPGVYVMEYATEQPIRGLAIKEVDARLVRIDVYTGPAGKIDIAGKDGWQEVAQYEQRRRQFYYPDENNNNKARYLDGYIDFGKEIKTRAVRLRLVEQWFDGGDRNTWGVRMDRGGQKIDPRRCRVYGAIPVQHLGGAAPADPLLTGRVEFYNAKSGKLEGEVPVADLSEIAFNTKGELFGIQGKNVVQIDLANGNCRAVVSGDLEKPRDLCFDSAGNLYVADVGEKRHHVRVYSPDGKFTRSIGVDGGFQLGAWNPQRLGQISSIDIDPQNQLWIVEEQYHPKRITIWSTDGTFKRELLGNTRYGGGGKLDPEDLSRVVYGPLEFELNWQTGATRLKNFLWNGYSPHGEIPMRRDGKLYFVSRPEFSTESVGMVYLYENDRLKPVAAMGRAIDFQPLKKGELVAELGHISLGEHRFIWADRNGDGTVQAAEVTVKPLDKMGNLTMFSKDFSIQSGPLRFEVKEFLPNGAPVYEEKLYPQLKGSLLYKLASGNYYRMGTSDSEREAVLAPDGRELWTYQQEGSPIGQALHNAKPWTPEQVVAEFGLIGHEVNEGHPLGEFWALHANTGSWNIWSHDGMLVGPLFRDGREREARPWSMREHQRGLMLTNVHPSEEHFSGHVCRGKDGKYYLVAGHNHISICEIVGFDKFKRFSGQIVVSPEDLKKLHAWETNRQKADVYMRAPVMDCYRVKRPPTIDGDLSEWEGPSASNGSDIQFHIGYDDHRLYLGYLVRDQGPFKNTGEQWDRLFKTGAAVDLQIGTDPNADASRAAPVAGDIRLLLTLMKDKPVAVLYRAVVPGTPEDKVWRVVSPVFEARFDEVRQVEDLKMAVKNEEQRYSVEASVPLSALDFKPQPGLRTKLDWGILVTGPNGTEVMRRMYWANKATGIVSDAPSEARLHPNLWGYALFQGARQSAAEQIAPGDGFKPAEPKKKKNEDLDELIDDLKVK